MDQFILDSMGMAILREKQVHILLGYILVDIRIVEAWNGRAGDLDDSAGLFEPF